MCYMVRQQQAEAAAGGATAPSGPQRLQPRWAGAAAALLIGSFALAALVGPTTTAPGVQAREPAAPVPVAVKAAAPAPAVVERSAAPVADDGVPAAADVQKAGAGYCQHGL